MDESRKVLVAHGEAGVRRAIVGFLSDHRVVAECSTVEELISAVAAHTPEVIVAGTEFPDGDGLSALIELSREQPIPSVVVTSERSLELVERAMRDHVMAYLLEPVRGGELQAAILLALARHEQLAHLTDQVDDLKQALADRKVIEKAKGALMAAEGLSESEAFGVLRRRAQNKRRRIAEEAEAVLRALAAQP